MKYVVSVLIAISICVANCENKDSKKVEQSRKVVEIYVDTTFGDTTLVSFVLSGIEYKVNYYKGKPQYIKVRRFVPIDSTTLSYERDNRGVFIVFDDSLNIQAFGCKYLFDNQFVKLQLDSISSAEYLEIGNGGFSDSMKKISVQR